MRGRGQVRESEPVEPVALDVVEATLPLLPTPVAAMVRLQLLSGCRPAEVINLTLDQIDRSGPVWAYRPTHHKNVHRGKPRVIFLGPEAQAVLAPFLDVSSPAAHLFSPRDHVERMRVARAAARKTKRPPSQLARTRKANPKRAPRDHYDRRSYYVAIVRAVTRANLARAEKQLAPLPYWSPLQLRHTAATAIQARFGLETARVILGHSRVETTQIYAERDLQKAAAAMAEIG